MNIVTTWDGEQFDQMEYAEAKKLEKEDKLQILSDGFISGLDLKYRHQFKGYQTRELRAEKPQKQKSGESKEKKPAPPPAKKPKAKKKVRSKK